MCAGLLTPLTPDLNDFRPLLGIPRFRLVTTTNLASGVPTLRSLFMKAERIERFAFMANITNLHSRSANPPLHYLVTLYHLPFNCVPFYAKNDLNIMECVTNTAEDVVIISLNSAAGDVPIELTIRSQLCCRPTASINMIDFQKRKFIASTINASSSTKPLHCSLSDFLMLLSPFASFFLWIVVTALLETGAIGNHVVPHIFTVF
jgi:hypothetical protein